jgi:Tol biopolymer transport system component
VHRLTESKTRQAPTSISPDGKWLAYYTAGGQNDIFIAPLEGDAAHPRLGKSELFVGTPYSEGAPMFSPDGRWIAYGSNESGRHEVYVRPFPGPGGRWQISTAGGVYPLWSRTGRELFFESPDRRIMSAAYTATGDSFAAAKARIWSETAVFDRVGFGSYDLAPDGKRFAVFLPNLDSADQKPVTHATFLLNFFDEVKRRAK